MDQHGGHEVVNHDKNFFRSERTGKKYYMFSAIAYSLMAIYFIVAAVVFNMFLLLAPAFIALVLAGLLFK